MINSNTRTYNYFTFGALNEYGEKVLSDVPAGQIKMDIELTSQTVKDNIKFCSATFIGITLDKRVNEDFVIQYGESKLKVLYTNKQGRFVLVYMEEV